MYKKGWFRRSVFLSNEERTNQINEIGSYKDNEPFIMPASPDRLSQDCQSYILSQITWVFPM